MLLVRVIDGTGTRAGYGADACTSVLLAGPQDRLLSGSSGQTSPSASWKEVAPT
jgi:hypothetical protein